MKTLESYLANVPDETLLRIEDELIAGVVPATGSAHDMIRKINSQIDKGSMCINTTTYRRVYLPTLAKAIHKELAMRYCNLFKNQGGHYVRANDNGNI